MKPKIITLLVFLIISFSVFSQKKNETAAAQFKVVGYYFLNAALRDSVHADSTYLFLNKITHLNIAFINPDSNGNFTRHLAIDTLIKKAHQKNVKVLASIAGGGSHAYYGSLLQDDKRPRFIKNLVDLTVQYDMDGIDVDLEGRDIDSNYDKFVTELARLLKKRNKLITAAIATSYRDVLPDHALRQFDFVNVMSYDRTGPWRPEQPGNHSPFEMAVQDLAYWHNIRAIPKEKLVLGLPFYGYGFGPVNSPVVSMSYKQIATLFTDRFNSDTLNLDGNVIMYFNNKGTIKNKTLLALKEAGGVMIWQLLGDAAGDLSLLDVIGEVVGKNKK
jgi:GH18 family chitinase